MTAALVLAAALSASSAPSGVPEPRGAQAPIYEPVPEAEAAAVKNPHAHRGQPFCQRCHQPGGPLRDTVTRLCVGCHAQRRENHPVDVTPKVAPRGSALPLTDGKVSCTSCHDPHAARAPMRVPMRQLCPTCHPGK